MSINIKNLDFEYLCTTIGNLSGIPVRLYEADKILFYHSISSLPVDPIVFYEKEILKIEESISYFATETFQYYGIVKSGKYKIVVGPSGMIQNSEQQLKHLAFNCNVPPEEINSFIDGMKSIAKMPLEVIMLMLCAINYILNGEKKHLTDISITDSEQNEITDSFLHDQYSEIDFTTSPIHNTFEIENAMTDMIQNGESEKLSKWISQIPAIRGGTIAPDQLRQRKNLFVVTATLASRAAIRGGLDINDAFTLSDSYIQKSELINNPSAITNLQYHMLIDFTEKVAQLRNDANTTKLSIKVANYVQQHISENIDTEEMAVELGFSRPYLSKKFKETTGKTLTDYIQTKKIDEAKRLLKYSDKSLSTISFYLGFSSQSHFCNIFKKITGKTPASYRRSF